MQGCASNGHCNICLLVSESDSDSDLIFRRTLLGYDAEEVCSHSHVVSPLKYFHLFRCSLLHVTQVRNLSMDWYAHLLDVSYQVDSAIV